MPIKLVSLNLSRQQPVPGYRHCCKQTGRIKKLNSARTRFSKIRTWFSNVRTRFSNVRTWLSNVYSFHEMYDASCALNMSYKTLHVHVCTVYGHVYIIQKQTKTYRRVHTCLNDVHTRLQFPLYIPCTYHVHTCSLICKLVCTCLKHVHAFSFLYIPCLSAAVDRHCT